MSYQCNAISNYIELRGLKFHYLTWGDKNKPILFMLHGFMDQSHAFDLIADELKNDFYMIAWDARGFGKTDRVHASGYYHFWEYIYDLELFINSFTNEKVTFIGHSMGGIIASIYAGIYPERVSKIVNMEGWFLNKSTFEDSPERAKMWIEGMKSLKQPKPLKNLDDAYNRVRLNDPFTEEKFIRHWINENTQIIDNELYWRHDNLHKTVAPQIGYLEQIKIFWERINCPILLLKGNKTIFPIHGTYDASSFFKNPDVYEINEAGHNLHINKPIEVSEKIKTFLEKN